MVIVRGHGLVREHLNDWRDDLIHVHLRGDFLYVTDVSIDSSTVLVGRRKTALRIRIEGIVIILFLRYYTQWQIALHFCDLHVRLVEHNVEDLADYFKVICAINRKHVIITDRAKASLRFIEKKFERPLFVFILNEVLHAICN